MQSAFFHRIGAVIVIAAAIGLLIVFGPLIAIPASFLLGGGAGALLGRCFTQSPEARKNSFTQLLLVLGGLVIALYVSSLAGMSGLTCLLAAVGFVIMFLMRNLTNFGSGTFINLLDQQDWTPLEEEIALRPIRQLIDRDNYRQALAELEGLCQTHKPTYEAVLLKAKLLNHLGRVDEARSALLSLIGFSNSTAQQLAVMEMLAALEDNESQTPTKPAQGRRRVEIGHELVLFQTTSSEAPAHKEIAPGIYDVEEIAHDNKRWLKLAAEDFGNAEMIWAAVAGSAHPAAAPARPGISQRITRMRHAILGKPRRQLLAEAQELFRDAKEHIRRDDWRSALPLLQKASACNPDHFEIAYRWATAVRQTATKAVTAEVMAQILKQSQWTRSEHEMFLQLLSAT